MRHPILVLLVFCGVALPGVTAETPARPSPPGSRRALLVAVSRYDRGQKRPWRNLTSYLDSQAIRSVLIRRFGFRPQDVLVVSDAGATRRGIIGAFENHLIAPAKPGDVLVFHFAGHGQPIADDNGDELDGLDESLVPYDYVGNSAVEGSRTNIRDDGLNELLARATAKLRPGGGDHGPTQGSTLVLLDCCHAGSATRGRQVARGRGWDERLDGP
ncbi:MAG TPA: caspase family protein, partial [Armatimonadota bacterium]|nr:caspase family protein [Armatimonadota bacterium]